MFRARNAVCIQSDLHALAQRHFKKNVGGTESIQVLIGQNPLGSSSPMWTTDGNLMWTQ